jgi:phage shock protein E
MANPIQTKIAAGARILDVRTLEEFAEEHYPNAINIPVSELQSRLGELGPTSTPLVVYCLSGARSAMATRLLKGAGYADVLNAGGLSDMPG